ncbi:MAG TPA: hypothetical protein PKA64_18690 [Myxococcota bacterium]|nr:hypothetical protein [Myxococcota bacterium]
MEIVAHEVAHALAGGGTGEYAVDRPDDPGETGADRTGRAFAAWVGRGMEGPAPQLRPARGGRAKVHRFASSEHNAAVDGAGARLQMSGQQVSKGTLDMMKEAITLGNGLTVTPGEVSSLMGDFYGVYDEDGSFDVDASFEALWSAPEGEMSRLLDLLAREREGEEISAVQWENATEKRQKTGGLSYLDLAKRNSNHFSKPTMTGTDNNMGTWKALHDNAVALAGSGDPKQRERAKALEAAAMHYLTDRFSAGHQIDKDGIMAATDHEKNSILANAHVLFLHDVLNEVGVSATNEAGDSWGLMGDGMWSSEANAENRMQLSRAIAASYGDLSDAFDGECSDHPNVRDLVPVFNPALQEGLETLVREDEGAMTDMMLGITNLPEAIPIGADQVGDGVVDGLTEAVNKPGQVIGQGLREVEEGLIWYDQVMSQGW